MSTPTSPELAEVRRRQHGDLTALVSARARAEEALSVAERRAMVDTFVTVIEGLYAHLPLKRARYGIDPVQRLRLLRDGGIAMSEADFHAELGSIVTGLRDAHTRYQGFGGAAGQVAVLPFLVETYGPGSGPSYIVSKVGPPDLVGEATFLPGVELLSWSGVPFDRAVQRWADNETGGRPDARRARALLSLTFRSLEFGPPPDEKWVIIGYRAADGTEREVRLPWRVISPDVAPTAVGQPVPRADAGTAALNGSPPQPRTRRRASRSRSIAAALALDPAAEAVRRARQLMFAPEVWWTATRAGDVPAVTTVPGPRRGDSSALESRMPDVLSARSVSTPSGEIGYLRIWSFSVNDDEAFVREVARLVDKLPTNGLVVDVRSNPGGLVWAAERALQLFTPQPIAPGRFSWLATDVTRALVANPVAAVDGRGGWARSLSDAVSTGDAYSQGLPLTDPEACNDIGQRYGGPVICVADANTYSAGDLFSAGFVDNRLGELVTVGEATGAGGANVWDDGLVRQALAGTRFGLPDLPAGVGFTVAVRRFTRVGSAAGSLVEDLGVPGDTNYTMTRTDLVEGNRDLLAWCAARLAAVPHSSLRVSERAGTLVVRSSGLDHIDLFTDRHPWTTLAPAAGPQRLPVPEGARMVEVVGWVGLEITQRRRVTLT